MTLLLAIAIISGCVPALIFALRVIRRWRAEVAELEASTWLEREAIARRIYPAEGIDAVMGYSAEKRAAITAAMTPREQRLLAQWELEHPKPRWPGERDWHRCPEDDYE